jgi:hypothetical protein
VVLNPAGLMALFVEQEQLAHTAVTLLLMHWALDVEAVAGLMEKLVEVELRAISAVMDQATGLVLE